MRTLSEDEDLARINDPDEVLERMRREDIERAEGAIHMALALAVVMWVAVIIALIVM